MNDEAQSGGLIDRHHPLVKFTAVIIIIILIKMIWDWIK
jgi:hypothetical protein